MVQIFSKVGQGKQLRLWPSLRQFFLMVTNKASIPKAKYKFCQSMMCRITYTHAQNKTGLEVNYIWWKLGPPLPFLLWGPQNAQSGDGGCPVFIQGVQVQLPVSHGSKIPSHDIMRVMKPESLAAGYCQSLSNNYLQDKGAIRPPTPCCFLLCF